MKNKFDLQMFAAPENLTGQAQIMVRARECYHDKLKGNGYLDELMSHVKNLEIRGIGM